MSKFAVTVVGEVDLGWIASEVIGNHFGGVNIQNADSCWSRLEDVLEALVGLANRANQRGLRIDIARWSGVAVKEEGSTHYGVGQQTRNKCPEEDGDNKANEELKLQLNAFCSVA